MHQSHSWKWLCSRFAEARDRAREADPETVRPCLPAVEQLDDRIMLSATPIRAAAQTPPGSVNAILIGLIKDGITLIKDEASFIKLEQIADKSGVLSQSDEASLLKIDEAFIKLDVTLYKEAQALLSGTLTLDKWRIDSALVGDSLKQIDGLASQLSEGAQQALLPAVQKVDAAVAGFQADVFKFSGLGGGVTTATFTGGVSVPSSTGDVITT